MTEPLASVIAMVKPEWPLVIYPKILILARKSIRINFLTSEMVILGQMTTGQGRVTNGQKYWKCLKMIEITVAMENFGPKWCKRKKIDVFELLPTLWDLSRYRSGGGLEPLIFTNGWLNFVSKLRQNPQFTHLVWYFRWKGELEFFFNYSTNCSRTPNVQYRANLQYSITFKYKIVANVSRKYWQKNETKPGKEPLQIIYFF